jgi:CheY-like chemotaxis protein
MIPPDSITILVAEDDADDRLMLQEAFGESGAAYNIQFVHDGQELMSRLVLSANQNDAELPTMVVLDLNMPKKDGREALREIKQNPKLAHIPVVVLTTSKSPEDIRNAYHLGANCYITKPVTFDSLMEMVRSFNRFWFGIVRLPS